MVTHRWTSRRSIGVLAVGLFVSLLPVAFRPLSGAPFARGDVDGSGRLSVLDAVHVLRGLFGGGDGALTCLDAADADDSGSLEVTDALYLLNALFAGGPVPRAPFPGCGEDPTADDLDCAAFDGCRATVFGIPVETGALVFVVDRSGSMQESGELQVAKQEIARVVEGLPETAEFGIVFVDRNVLKFPQSGAAAAASAEMKDAALAWLQGIPGGAGSCPQQGLVAALDMANGAVNTRRTVVYIGDGGGTCGGANEQVYLRQTLDVVAARNTEGVIIHAVGVLNVGILQRDFLTQLARDNGGIFVEVTR